VLGEKGKEGRRKKEEGRGKREEEIKRNYAQCPMPNAQCPIPLPLFKFKLITAVHYVNQRRTPIVCQGGSDF
jgi:hypothetical protein